MTSEEFYGKYLDSLSKGIIEEGCVGDFFDLVLESIKSEQRETISFIKILYTHMLKYYYQPNYQTPSWIKSIRNSNSEINLRLKYSKNIWNSINEDILDSVFIDSVYEASKETGIDKSKFPKSRDELPGDIRSYFIKESISDREIIEEFMKNYAYTNSAKKYLYLI